MIKLGKDPNTEKYVDEVVIPIQILSDLLYSPVSEWNTIGYPQVSIENPHGKMSERSGTLFASGGGAIYKHGTVPIGNSGGPWIFAGSNGHANGVHAGNVVTQNCEASPYFTSTVDELVKLYFP